MGERIADSDLTERIKEIRREQEQGARCAAGEHDWRYDSDRCGFCGIPKTASSGGIASCFGMPGSPELRRDRDGMWWLDWPPPVHGPFAKLACAFAAAGVLPKTVRRAS
ncbi:MAG TPA: hypothetical protein VFA12_20530 [Stellaceae bacterium]|nr:hypothetical protein [Stellaceae bacterium]